MHARVRCVFMHITIVGHVAIDENISEHSSYISAGGPAVFIHTIFSQLPDCRVAVIAPYGHDFVPHVQDMALFPNMPSATRSLVYKNVTKHGTRQQKAMYRKTALPIPIDGVVEGVISHSDIVFIAPLLPNFSESYIATITSACKTDALIVLLPQGYYRNFDAEDTVIGRDFSEAHTILGSVHIVIVSIEDHPDMRHIAQEWSNAHTDLIVVMTDSENGAVIYQNNKKYVIETSPVAAEDIVDSVGAGDIFSAAFGYQYKKTHDIKKAATFANAVARQSLFFQPKEIRIDPDTYV